MDQTNEEFIMSEVQKEEKPKKMFTIVHTIWDDGEIDSEMYEFRKNPSGRGAPGKWRLGAKDFKRRVEELFGDPANLSDELVDNTGLVAEDTPANGLKPLNVPKNHVPDPQELAELDAGAGEESVAPEKEENIDFGDFDVEK